MQQSLAKLRQRFDADRFATGMGAVIEQAADGRATVAMTAGPQHLNAAGGVQGGALFTLGDFAFAVAANAAGPLTVSLQSSIQFLQGAKPGRITAEAVRVHQTRRTCCYEVQVCDSDGAPLARMSVTGYCVAPSNEKGKSEERT